MDKEKETVNVLVPGEFIGAIPIRQDLTCLPEDTAVAEYDELALVREMHHPHSTGVLDLSLEHEKHESEHESCDPCCGWTVPAQWDMFRGDNHSGIMNHRGHFGGSVQFSYHIGRSLTDELWVDLIYRMHIHGLRIYRKGESRWADGHGEGFCVITLDENELVRDIEYYPYRSPSHKKVDSVSLLRALEVAVAKAEGREPRTYEGCWRIAGRKGFSDPSWDEVKEALDIAWESANKKFKFYECPPVAYINDYATAKIKIV